MSTTPPWAFDGNLLGVDVSVVDTYGNAVQDEPTRVTLIDGTDEIETDVVNGRTRFEIDHGTAGSTYNLRVQSDRFTTSMAPIPIVRDCPDETAKYLEIIGAEDGRVCLTEGGEARVRLIAPTTAADWVVTQDGRSLDTTEETAIDPVDHQGCKVRVLYCLTMIAAGRGAPNLHWFGFGSHRRLR